MKAIIPFRFLATLAIALCCNIASLSAQEADWKLSDFQDGDGWYQFQDQIQISANDLFVKYGKQLGLGQNDEAIINRQEKDGDGITHTHYSQYYKGILVEKSHFSTHSSTDFIEVAHGTFAPNLSLDVAPILGQSEALTAAMTAIGAQSYPWQNDASLTPPEGTLIIYSTTDSRGQEKDFVLAYKFNIAATEPATLQTVYIDANTGSLLSMFDPTLYENEGSDHDIAYKCDSDNQIHKQDESPQNILSGPFEDGTCNTLYNGTRNINTHVVCNIFGTKINWYLDGWRHVNTKTYDGVDSYNQPEGLFVYNTSTTWSTNKRDETSTHWAAERTVDYFRDNYARSGPDGNNRDIRIFVGEEVDPLNSYYRAPTSNFFDCISIEKTPYNGEFVSAATLDIVAHEVAHSYVQATSNLNAITNGGEPRALNESFADIFGEVIEAYVVGTPDWIHGNQIALPLNKYNSKRSFTDPSAGVSASNTMTFLYGASVGSTHWADLSPYQQMGVQNRWFYLLVNGGEANNTSVSGIGITKAAKIAYMNMTQYLQSGANFAAARTGSINAAIAAYGKCSNEVRQVRNAWKAVGVGDNIENTACIALNNRSVLACETFGPTSYTYNTTVYPVGSNVSWSYTSPYWSPFVTTTPNTFSVSNTGYHNGRVTATITAAGYTTSDYRTVSYHNCDGGGCSGCAVRLANPSTAASQQGLTIKPYSVYPNPAGNLLNILSNEKVIDIRFVNVTGEMIKIVPNASYNNAIDLSDINNGIYFVQIQTGGQNFVERVVILRK